MSPTYRQVCGILLALAVAVCSLYPPVRTILSLPDSQSIVVGEKLTLPLQVPARLRSAFEVSVRGPSRTVFSPPSDQPVTVDQEETSYDILALRPGQADVELKLGNIPLKSIKVESLAPRRLVPGGHSIGVLLKSRGIMVVGYAPVLDQSGEKDYPAKEEGVEIGDVIIAVNGRAVYTETELAELIDQAGKENQPLNLTLKRGENQVKVEVSPSFCSETNRYRIGLYVRDGVAGVGTLSFWDPLTGRYAALGHIIADVDTRKGIDVRQGKIVGASVQTIRPAQPGRPGEKIGLFDPESLLTGDIEKNTFAGVFGTTQEVKNPLFAYPLEVGYAHQVREGKASILTVINGNEIESFDISIEKVYTSRQNGKGMVIRITDPRLLSVTGGIVQGMSGSPIIQDNRIVGVVTHVFLNDPQRGYGTFMDSMLKELESMGSGLKNFRQNAS
ncbi:MAG TPA: SpoIVB peptidase [Syntrophothermus lipocalidus]|nr:SpoIVB peptidase [Syntrophothermus lipocalidus]